jgi:uncharacterized protein (DUF58 family)
VTRWQARWISWLARSKQPRHQIRLTRHRVYIFTTGFGMVFWGTLLAMWVGSLNYELALGYGLTFLLAGVALVSVFHTFRNLLHLELLAGRCEPVFAGEMAQFEIVLHNPTRLPRFALFSQWEQMAPVGVDVPAQGRTSLTLTLPAPRRGRLAAPRVRLQTIYPLGLFRAWTWAWLDLRCVVYPQPAAYAPPLPWQAGLQGQGARATHGQEDFAGLRSFQPTDSPRHIAWKQSARTGQLMSKQFAGESAPQLWLDWYELPRTLPEEDKLSILTRWLLDADQAGYTYGLRLPTLDIPLNRGPQHLRHCLETVALY